MAIRPPRATINQPRPVATIHAPNATHVIAMAPQPTTVRPPTKPKPKPKPAPKPAAAAPLAPLTPPADPSVAPPDPITTGTINALGQTQRDTLAGLGQQRTAGLLGYGYDEDANTGALALDPNNPFSKAAELKRTYDTSRRSTGQTMAAGGQLYSGAYQNAQDAINRGQLGGQDALQKNLSAFLAENSANVAAAKNAYDLGVPQAQAEGLARLKDNPLYNPLANTPVPGAKPAAKPPAAYKPPPVTKLTPAQQLAALKASVGKYKAGEKKKYLAGQKKRRK